MDNIAVSYGSAGFEGLYLEEPYIVKFYPWGTYGSTAPGLPEDTAVLTSYLHSQMVISSIP